MNLITDIETGRNIDHLKFMPSFEANKTLKDPEKVKCDLDKKQNEWLDKCALSHFTGEILLIGTLIDNEYYPMAGDVSGEIDMLNHYWKYYTESDRVITFSGKSFDFPMLIKRSWFHKVYIPNNVYKLYNGRFYFDEKILDLREILGCGAYQPQGTLSDWQKYFGLQVKDDSISENFEKVWHEDRDKAIENNRVEVESIKQIYEIIS